MGDWRERVEVKKEKNKGTTTRVPTPEHLVNMVTRTKPPILCCFRAKVLLNNAVKCSYVRSGYAL